MKKAWIIDGVVQDVAPFGIEPVAAFGVEIGANYNIDVPDDVAHGWRQDETGAWVEPPAPIDSGPSAVQLIRHYDGIVQTHLDSVAQSFGYGDPNRPDISPILHAISYADEPAVPRFADEGKALRAWRSTVWATAAGILNAVKTGTRTVPTETELLAELPAAPVQQPL